MRPRVLDEEDAPPNPKDLEGKFTFQDMCVLVVPEPLFRVLSREAHVRNKTLAEFLAASVEAYLHYGAEPQVQEAPIANFELRDGLDSSSLEEGVGVKRPKLRGYR